MPLIGHYQIVSCAFGTFVVLNGSPPRLSLSATVVDSNSSWISRLQDNGSYQLKTKGGSIATASATDSFEEAGEDFSENGSGSIEWDILQISTDHFRIQHPDLNLCWGVIESVQEQVSLCNSTDDPQNCWRIEPLKAKQVRPGSYRILNIGHGHVLFGSTGDSPPTDIWRVLRGSYTIDRIQNKTHKFFVFCAQSTTAGTSIMGSKDQATEWDIRNVPDSQTLFLISPKGIPHLYWGYPETNDPNMSLQLREGEGDSKNHWEFQFAD
ncbi:hypothetical protein FRC07_012408 [Ceratobasidium sp. 392]|nr:hypothetical protein FRC07_012408 [Ceratobasidium sp. 392]